jgi:hypothetical protein
VNFLEGGPHHPSIETQGVVVCEDQTTEMRVFGPAGRRPLTVELRIGDGSIAQYRSGSGHSDKPEQAKVTDPEPGAQAALEPMVHFRVKLVPRTRQPLSYAQSEWVGFDAKGQVVLSDVSPGAYRLQVIQRVGPDVVGEEVIFERDITVPTDAQPVKVSLGGGSIKGEFVGAGDAARWGEVIAVAQGGKGPTRRTRCDYSGNYCVRYLDPGTYTLFAHFSKGGWSHVENVKVASNVTDVGERRLTPGGTVRGSISFRRPCPVPDEIIANGPSDVSLEFPIGSISNLDQFELGSLWPGRWTIVVRGGGEVLATANTEISGTEKVGIKLATDTEKGP